MATKINLSSYPINSNMRFHLVSTQIFLLCLYFERSHAHIKKIAATTICLHLRFNKFHSNGFSFCAKSLFPIFLYIFYFYLLFSSMSDAVLPWHRFLPVFVCMNYESAASICLLIFFFIPQSS